MIVSGYTLYIGRHAKSSWDDPHLRDFDRPLNARGLRDAPRMARYLRDAGVRPHLLLASPALRAWTTAEIYHDLLGGILRADERIYDASVQALQQLALEALRHDREVMIVGHNPGMSELISRVSDQPSVHLPTAGVVAVHWEGEPMKQPGSVRFFLYPKVLPNK